MANGAALIAIALFICIEAYRRFHNPLSIKSGLMFAIAVGGLVINMISLWVLSGGRKSNLNIRVAYLHVLTDALGSIGAIGSAILIGLWGWALSKHKTTSNAGAIQLCS